jgi:hypothetical protein
MSETPIMDQCAYPLMSQREQAILAMGRRVERKMAIYEEALRTIATDPCNPRLDYIGIADEALDEARDILSNKQICEPEQMPEQRNRTP